MRAFYEAHRRLARSTSTPWRLNYDTWNAVWEASPFAEQRDPASAVMVRRDESGPYSPDNVEVLSVHANRDQPRVRNEQRHLLNILNAQQPKQPKQPKRHADHLKDRTKHPRNNAVRAPDGTTYVSAREAAEAVGITRQAMANRCRSGGNGWSYVGITNAPSPCLRSVVDHEGKTHRSITEAARRHDISATAAKYRAENGVYGWRFG